MSYNQTNTEYGTSGTGTTGQGTGSNIINKVKEAIPGMHPNTNTGTGMGTGNMPSSGLGGTSGAYDSNVGGHGHHHHAGGAMGGDTTATGTGGGVLGQVKQHIPGTTEHQLKQDMQGATTGHHSTGAYSGSGTTTGGGMMGQVKEHIPGTTEHQMKQGMQGSGMGATSDAYDSNVSGLGGSGIAPGTGGMTTETTGHAGHHHHAGGLMGSGTTATGTGSTMGGIKQHVPGTTEHQMKQGLGGDVGSGVGGMHTSSTHTSHTGTHHSATGAGEGETMKEKILKHVPGTEERAQYKATGTAAGSADATGAGSGRTI